VCLGVGCEFQLYFACSLNPVTSARLPGTFLLPSVSNWKVHLKVLMPTCVFLSQSKAMQHWRTWKECLGHCCATQRDLEKPQIPQGANTLGPDVASASPPAKAWELLHGSTTLRAVPCLPPPSEDWPALSSSNISLLGSTCACHPSTRQALSSC
jgi:hypothetical protein